MFNQIAIMGRLTRDPELRRTGSGTPVANFTIACCRDYKLENGERETDFIECVAWRQTGEFVSKYFHKGDMAVVTGRLQIRTWTDNGGVKRLTAEIVADSIYFAESKKTEPAQNASPTTYAAPPHDVKDDYAVLDYGDEQLPF